MRLPAVRESVAGARTSREGSAARLRNAELLSGDVRLMEVEENLMTKLERLIEFCVRYYGGDNYEMCDNSNLRE
jgi:hypothetical protein